MKQKQAVKIDGKKMAMSYHLPFSQFELKTDCSPTDNGR
jgi:hypothetical protein